MPLEPLITPDDCEFYGYRNIEPWMLDRASARVRAYTKQRITRNLHQVLKAPTDSIVILDAPYRLPERPVREVTSITTVPPVGSEATGRELVEGDWELAGGGFLVLSVTDKVEVTYTHGFDAPGAPDEENPFPLPDELVEIVCNIAFRLSTTPSQLASGTQSEGTGGESVSYGAQAYQGVAHLTPAEKEVLDRIFALKMPSRIEML